MIPAATRAIRACDDTPRAAVTGVDPPERVCFSWR